MSECESCGAVIQQDQMICHRCGKIRPNSDTKELHSDQLLKEIEEKKNDPFSLQNILHNMVSTQRAEEMKNSPQLTLGELILKLETIKDQTKPVYYDFNTEENERIIPGIADSWRGSYEELAIEYGIPDPPALKHPVNNFLSILKDAIGETFKGYKGGDFTMGKTTPVWVANYSENFVGRYKGEIGVTVGIIDVIENNNEVILVTKHIDY